MKKYLIKLACKYLNLLEIPSALDTSFSQRETEKYEVETLICKREVFNSEYSRKVAKIQLVADLTDSLSEMGFVSITTEKTARADRRILTASIKVFKPVN